MQDIAHWPTSGLVIVPPNRPDVELNARINALMVNEGLALSEASARVIREYPDVAAQCGLALDDDGTVKLAEGGI
jgi:hypothetical protein